MPEEQALMEGMGDLLAGSLEEQGLQEQDMAYDLNAMGDWLDGQKFAQDPLQGAEDFASYADQASQFVDDMIQDQAGLQKYLGEVTDLQGKIDAQRKLDMAAADKVGIPLEDWYKKFGQSEFKRENEARLKLGDANARFQEAQLKYNDKLLKQSEKFLSGWDKFKDGATDKKMLQDMQKLFGEAFKGDKSFAHQSLQSLRGASGGTRDLIRDADKYQGKLDPSGDKKLSPYEQSQYFQKLGVQSSKEALAMIDTQIGWMTGKDSSMQKLMDKFAEQEKRLKDNPQAQYSKPFLPPQ
jgi:hypothetical protein